MGEYLGLFEKYDGKSTKVQSECLADWYQLSYLLFNDISVRKGIALEQHFCLYEPCLSRIFCHHSFCSCEEQD